MKWFNQLQIELGLKIYKQWDIQKKLSKRKLKQSQNNDTKKR